ncbi:MAG: hypothetical protein IKB43_09720 [Fibrobacter sp.]|uniref:hypothetical protein n=1 Tax=uncultured Fibrobacter sp. TaxID=261512 RepID=UPI0025E3C55E|nr:hypothetical protein [uncultured Fibrobacter sp.]MBR2470401.1 hypothetical protein [Fibrobacter sp.]
MKKRNVNLLLFSLVLIFLISVPILRLDEGRSTMNDWDRSPWHLTPFDADSLSQYYKNHYPILDENPLKSILQDSTKSLVMVLIDSWGVPYNEEQLVSDFQMINENNVFYAIHKRRAQNTSLAENTEYGEGFKEGIFLATIGSSDCEQTETVESSLFKQILCCENCDDSRAVATLDSLITDETWSRIAWTARSTREGDRDKLHQLLKELSNLTTKHPDVQFVIQGTHRPILGSPETRRMYLAPWVPAVFVNCDLTLPH